MTLERTETVLQECDSRCAFVPEPPGKSLKAGSGKSFSSAEGDSSVAAASSAKKDQVSVCMLRG